MSKFESSIRKPILIVGIGNILLRDEGIGPAVIASLNKMDLPDEVELLDGGTAGADILDFICNREKVIFIDAIDSDVESGTILRMKSEDIESTSSGISLHEFGLVETLAMSRHLKCEPSEIVIIGVKPKDIDWGTELTEELSRVVPLIIDLVLSEAGISQKSS